MAVFAPRFHLARLLALQAAVATAPAHAPAKAVRGEQERDKDALATLA
jgi:hypothetical protein